MTNFFGSFIYGNHRPNLLGAPAAVYSVDTSGVIDVPVEISQFNIVVRDFGYSWSSEDAFKVDGSFYGADRGQGTAVVFGNFPGNVSIDWSFGAQGAGRFLGVFNADATAIIGHAVVDDSGLLPGIDVPLILTASPSITLTDSQYIIALENLENADKALSFVSLLLDIAIIADARQLSWNEVDEILESPEFRALHAINNIIGGVAAGIQAGKDIQKGDWPGAFADIATFTTKMVLDETLGEVIDTGVELEAGGIPAGRALIAFGVGAKVNLIIMDDSISRELKGAYAEAFTAVLNHLTSAGSAQADTGALAESLAATVAETLQFSVPDHTISKFDPGYYLAAHADAVAPVASGAYANAYAYYLTVGVDRGDRPSAASAPVAASDIPDLALLRSGLNGFAPLYTGIFDLALGSMPTDGISTVVQSVAQIALAGHGSADATLTGLANRLAIDLARNQHYSGMSADIAAGQFPFSLSIGADIADLQAAGAPGFGSFSYYVLSTAPGATIAQIQTALHNDVLLANTAVTGATHFGIAEFGGVWVAIIANANAGTQIHAPLSEASGSAAINFYGTDGVDFIYLGAHAGTALGGGGSDILTGSPGNDTLNGGPGLDIAMYSGPRSAYTLTHSGIGLVISGPDAPAPLTPTRNSAFPDKTTRPGLKGGAPDSGPEDSATSSGATTTARHRSGITARSAAPTSLPSPASSPTAGISPTPATSTATATATFSGATTTARCRSGITARSASLTSLPMPAWCRTAGTSPAPATSTATAGWTFCGATTTARPRSGTTARSAARTSSPMPAWSRTAGISRAPAISTATVTATSCGATTTARFRSGITARSAAPTSLPARA